jgi:hypothetical protein
VSEIVRVQWRGVQVGDRVLYNDTPWQVTSTDHGGTGMVQLKDAAGAQRGGRPDPRSWVELVAPTHAEAVATIKDALGASTLADEVQGQATRCPPMSQLVGDAERLAEHLQAFHDGDLLTKHVSLHDAGVVAVPHRH